MSSRPLPPYATELRKWLRSDPKPRMWGCNDDRAAITVLIGANAWGIARSRHEDRLVLCLPPGESAAKFNWQDCAGSDPILIELCGDVADGVVDSLIRSLLRDGVKRILDVGTMDRFEAEVVQHVAA